MSKDPAFLFYPGDWLGGTITFTRSQKGAYMDLLMAQFNQVALTIEDIRQVLGIDYDLMWEPKLRVKFETESNGILYFNRKLRDEVIKRKSFTESRRNNKTGKNQYNSGHMTNHMTSHMENENENENKDIIKKDRIVKERRFIPPTIEEVIAYCLERKNNVDPHKWHAWYSANGWMVGKNKMKDWKAAVRTWENKEIKDNKKWL